MGKNVVESRGFTTSKQPQDFDLQVTVGIRMEAIWSSTKAYNRWIDDTQVKQSILFENAAGE